MKKLDSDFQVGSHSKYLSIPISLTNQNGSRLEDAPPHPHPRACAHTHAFCQVLILQLQDLEEVQRLFSWGLSPTGWQEGFGRVGQLLTSQYKRIFIFYLPLCFYWYIQAKMIQAKYHVLGKSAKVGSQNLSHQKINK